MVVIEPRECDDAVVLVIDVKFDLPTVLVLLVPACAPMVAVTEQDWSSDSFLSSLRKYTMVSATETVRFAPKQRWK